MARKINWNKWVAIGTFTLALIAVVALFFSWCASNRANDLSEMLIERTPTYYPDIEVKLSRTGEFFNDFDLKDLHKVQDVSGLYLSGKKLGIIYRNRGLEDSGPINLNLWDERFNYVPSIYGYHLHVSNISSLDSGEAIFEISHPSCKSTNKDYNIKKNLDNCKEAYVEKGLINWILKVDCPFCKQRQKCYSFSVCITNSTYQVQDCYEENKEWDSDLKLLDKCPSQKIT